MKYLEFNYQSHKKIWGTEKWIISAHENGESVLKNNNESLTHYYNKHREAFGKNMPEEFPLLVKIIDTFDDLSIQVHPDDEYAKKNENSLGKSECWYILDAKDTDIIAGQKKITREEVETAIANNSFLDLCELQTIKKGDFFYIPTGCIHAIRKNTSLLEIQQSSDITYRLYDYDRRDDLGNPRELHIEKSLDVIDYDYENNSTPIVVDEHLTKLVESEHFYVDIFTNIDREIVAPNYFKFIIAIDGDMYVDGKQIKQNEGIILLANKKVKVKSEYKVIVSSIKRGE